MPKPFLSQLVIVFSFRYFKRSLVFALKFFVDDKKYFVKITTSNKKFDLITKIFKIEVVDPDLYRM